MAKRAWNTRAVDCSYCGSPAPNHNLGCPVALDELMEKRAAPPQPAPDAVRERAAVALLEVRNFEGETIARFKQSNDVMWREALQSADTVLAALAPPLPSGEPLVKGQISEIIRELREEYPALDVTTVVFCKDFAGVACCVIPHARVMAIIEALSQFARPVGRTRGPS
jgi:hypothetical protein